MPPAAPGPGRRLTQSLIRTPLRVRLVLIVLVLLAAALLVATAATGFLVKRDLQARLDSELVAVADPVANQAIESMSGGDATIPTGYAFIVRPFFGTGIIVNPTGETARPKLPALTANDPRVVQGTPFTVGSMNGETQWRFVARVYGHESGIYAVGVPLTSLRRTVASVLLVMLGVSAVLLALSGVLGWYAVRRAMRPLARIEDTAAAIAAGDLTRRMPLEDAGDEVTSLSRSLNVMLSQIESSFAVREASEERMRQFVADASHELRTPLVTIRGYAELYRQGGVRDPEEVSGAMGRIESEARRMGGLVEDLLTLARLDATPAGEATTVDLTVLAADTAEDAAVRAPDRRITVRGLVGELGPVPVRGVESRLRQVVTNLVANALQHTPAGTPVEILVGTIEGTTAVLEVRDHGPGIPAETATKVFERFYRADPSRGRGEGGGNGLGLAIVAAIVAAHRGRVGVAETPGGGATFVVSLPVHEAGSAIPEADDEDAVAPADPGLADGSQEHSRAL